MLIPLWVLACCFTDSALTDQFLERYEARFQSLENAVITSEWHDFYNGQPMRNEYHTQVLDDLGRWRWKTRVEQVIPFPFLDSEEGESTDIERDYRFNGEITAIVSYSPIRDSDGKLKTNDEQGEYRAAQIHEGSWNGLDSSRSPLSFLDFYVKSLREASNNGQPIDIAETAEGLFSFTFPAQQADVSLKITIDPSQGFMPVACVESKNTGSIIRKLVAEYELYDPNVFIMKTMSLRTYGENQNTPILEMVNTVTDCKINDPNFSEDHFEIVLTKDTMIQDIRYDGVVYRADAEETKSTEITALAKAALKKKMEIESASNVETPLRNSGTFSWAFWLNVAVLSIAAIVYFWKRN